MNFELTNALSKAAAHYCHKHGSDTVLYTARPSSNGSTIFLSCQTFRDGETTRWTCAPIEEEASNNNDESTMFACTDIKAQNRFSCRVVGTIDKKSW